MLFLSLKKGFENEIQESVIFRKKKKLKPTQPLIGLIKPLSFPSKFKFSLFVQIIVFALCRKGLHLLMYTMNKLFLLCSWMNTLSVLLETF